ncbi:hypothetical protein [Bacillus coahuilensis]|uniref:hypothetical protein n=1 Tax=Bacillus coahuilensis TaxID=408580 RepID=UPI00018506E4|nr:hypothetical protein [Bacillus coahuilensis]
MNFIEIPLTKCKIFLTEKELVGLLSKDVELYKESLQRGKAFTRSKRQLEREEKHFRNYEASVLQKKYTLICKERTNGFL